MVRFVIILAVAAVVVVVFWPLIRQLDPARLRDERAARRKSGPIFFAIVITLGLSMVLSTALWLMSK